MRNILTLLSTLAALFSIACSTTEPKQTLPDPVSTSPNHTNQFSGTWAGYTPIYQQDFAKAFIKNGRNANKGTGYGLYYDKRGQRIKNSFRWMLEGDKLTVIYPPKPELKSGYGRLHVNFSKKITVVYSVKWVSPRHAKFVFSWSSIPIRGVNRGDVFDVFKSPHENLDDSIDWYNEKIAAPPF